MQRPNDMMTMIRTLLLFFTTRKNDNNIITRHTPRRRRRRGVDENIRTILGWAGGTEIERRRRIYGRAHFATLPRSARRRTRVINEKRLE